MTKDEALKLAQRALSNKNASTKSIYEALAAIKEVLAQPEESLELFEYWNAVEGWVKIEEVRKHFGSVGCGTIYKTAGEDRVPVYTTPPKRPWVGLTATAKLDLLSTAKGAGGRINGDAQLLELLTDHETQLKRKNT